MRAILLSLMLVTPLPSFAFVDAMSDAKVQQAKKLAGELLAGHETALSAEVTTYLQRSPEKSPEEVSKPDFFKRVAGCQVLNGSVELEGRISRVVIYFKCPHKPDVEAFKSLQLVSENGALKAVVLADFPTLFRVHHG